MRKLLLIAVVLLAGVSRTGEMRTALERIHPDRLRAVSEARASIEKQRATKFVPQNGVYQDYRAVLNVPADDAALPEVMEAAKKTGVNVIMLSGSKRGGETKDGILMLNGAEDRARGLRVDSSGMKWLANPISFRPLAEGQLAKDSPGYVISSMSSHIQSFGELLNSKSAVKDEWTGILEAFKQYPHEVYAACFGDTKALKVIDDTLSNRQCCCVADNAARPALTVAGTKFDSYELNFKTMTTHILARDLSEAEIRNSLRTGRTYVCHDWLADPSRFMFGAANILGTFFMGDTVPFYAGDVNVVAFSPVPAHMRIFHNGKVVAEKEGYELWHKTRESGAYRCEVSLKIDGEERPWIMTSPVYIDGSILSTMDALKVPPTKISPEVELIKDVKYVDGLPEDEQKHQLDIYRPRDKKNVPIFFFIHGGAWRFGDRWQYLPLANHFATKGLLTFAPSYRLARSPETKHPAQIKDVAAAFKWVIDHAAEYGGDLDRIYIGGHSAGGHLAALLLFDERYLAAHQLSRDRIKGAICLSGVYDLTAIGDRETSVFGSDPQGRKDASPLFHVKGPFPRMLISSCEHDYFSLPQQARDLYNAVKAKGADAEILFVPKENHISEMVNITEPGDLTSAAIVKFIK